MSLPFEPTVDVVFKKIFADVSNKDCLLSLVNAFLDFRIIDLTVVNPEVPPELLGDKLARLDILAVTESGDSVNIEVQVANQRDIDSRVLFYWSKLFASQLKEGDVYRSLKKTISIVILRFVWFKQEASAHNVYEVRNRDTGSRLSPHLQLHFLEIPKIEPNKVKMNDALLRWALFLSNPSAGVLKEISMGDKAIQKAASLVEIMAQDKRERFIYEARFKAMLDEASNLDGARQDGIEQGKAMGQQDALFRSVLRMHEKRFGQAASSALQKHLSMQPSEGLELLQLALFDFEDAKSFESSFEPF